ncbi:MAG: hypothetical protein DMG57_35740 [Acidobacteria bacterium]|nr:MAG: hypothetical protein DMG57_35740 [Acidobacteriota bacterium]
MALVDRGECNFRPRARDGGIARRFERRSEGKLARIECGKTALSRIHGNSRSGRLLVLLIGAGLLVRSFVRLERTSTGFRPGKVLTAIIPLPVTDYPLPSQRIAFERALLERVRALPGVQSAGAIDFPPFSGGAGSHIEIIGHPRDMNEPTQVVYQTPSSPGYLETMGIPLVRGRIINSSDDQGALPVCDIDETVARKFFANLNPVGMHVLLPIPNITCTVVGVVGATKSNNLSDPPTPRIYYSSNCDSDTGGAVGVSSAGNGVARRAGR